MGIYRPLVSRAQNLNKSVADAEISTKIITPATLMTAARPPLAAVAATKLVRGERYVTPLVIGVGLTDAEGNVARVTDRVFPAWGRGVTKWGALGDPYADTVAVLEIAGAAMFAPRVSKTAKGALAVAFGSEALKTAWAVSAANEYRQATVSEEHPRGELLRLPVEEIGKEAMFEKLLALVFATATNDVDPGRIRTGLGLAALAHATAGAYHGEQARQAYVPMIEDMLLEHRDMPLPQTSTPPRAVK